MDCGLIRYTLINGHSRCPNKTRGCCRTVRNLHLGLNGRTSVRQIQQDAPPVAGRRGRALVFRGESIGFLEVVGAIGPRIGHDFVVRWLEWHP